MKRITLSLLAILMAVVSASAQQMVLKGDANGDGRITMADAKLAAQAYLSIVPTDINAAAADMDGDGVITVADANAILNKVLGCLDGHEYVEIDGIKWAKMNVGATTEAGSYKTCYGDFFAWGETEPNYSSMTYTSATTATFVWKGGKQGYTMRPNYAEEELDAEHDAATQAWGGTWRTPGRVEFEALAEACTGSKSIQTATELTSKVEKGGIYRLSADQTFEPEYTGVAGILFVAQADITKKVFFPATGYMSGTTWSNPGTYGYLWSSSLYTTNTTYAYALGLLNSSVRPSANEYTSRGFTVRPVSGVRRGAVAVESITISGTSNILIGGPATLRATVLPANATNGAVTWTSSDPEVATVTNTGGINTQVTALKCGTATITATAKDGSGVFATITVTIGEQTIDGHGYVDLGLPSGIKWATVNVGADCPEGCGNYFAWGETTGMNEGKYTFNNTTYKWYDNATEKFTKYCTDEDEGIVDNKTQLEASDDAATANWGKNWRTPTEAEMKELIDNCTWTWTSLEGIDGYKVASKVNGNSIFLPAWGLSDIHYMLHKILTDGYYWTSSLDTTFGGRFAKTLAFVNNLFDGNFTNRSYGLQVRAVSGTVNVQSMTLSKTNVTIDAGEKFTITVTMLPEIATNKTYNWTSSDNSVVYPNKEAAGYKFLAQKEGTATLTCTANDGSGVKATCTVTVKKAATPPTPDVVKVQSIQLEQTEVTIKAHQSFTLGVEVLPATATDKSYTWTTSDNTIVVVTKDASGYMFHTQKKGTCTLTCTANDGSGVVATCNVRVKIQDVAHEYVDLGLPSGTLWATTNIGALQPEDYGDYFAWGELTGYDDGKEDFSWNTYKWYNASEKYFKKYCKEDGLNSLQAADDAALSNWGRLWRIPSTEDIKELFNNCTFNRTTRNGVKGYEVVGKNGNSIFLPGAGYYNGEELKYAGTTGVYWSSTLGEIFDSAEHLYFDNTSLHYNSCDLRYIGASIRPVTGIKLKQYEMTVYEGNTTTLSVYAPNQLDYNTYSWTSSDNSVVMVEKGDNGNSVMNALKPGSVTLTCKANDGSGLTATCTVTVISLEKKDGHQYVDLGLPSGVKWATCNVGAGSPEEIGNYFAWGETTGLLEGKTKFYWEKYKWAKTNTGDQVTKYCTDSKYGKVDNRNELYYEDDAAYANWGKNWRMPTKEEMLELLSNCSMDPKSVNGVKGLLLTSKINGNRIFFPLTGRYFDGFELPEQAYYWTCSLNETRNGQANALQVMEYANVPSGYYIN